ncbi:hypothetical protein BBO_06585 [Beauveria brongniartii RCEF 3172]|uniref:Uncharacterized protein n=1 Tax=Beauveria brongniartii RCEF 3172 TaxID=1081107 RepID=A0A162J576_9HYPO|nr:hypothetical protein BBO_06585 [Beauveria brongniartii RCEF 3172]
MSIPFARLPLELRHAIWTLALGEHGDNPTMVPFRTSRPWMLEEEDDDEDMLLDEDDIDELLSDNQLEEIRELALHQVAEQNENGNLVTAAPTTLPSNGVARLAEDEGEGAGNVETRAEAGREAAADARDQVGADANGEDGDDNQQYGEDNEDEDDDDGDDDDDEDHEQDDYAEAEDFYADMGEFEPGNPYTQEPVWDDEVVIPVYVPPLLLVNREARDITLRWLAKHDIQLLRTTIAKDEINTGFALTEDGLEPYTRKYDPERDHLYVDRRFWRRFCDRIYMPHMMAPLDSDDPEEQHQQQESVIDIGKTIKYLALPAFTVYQSVDAFAGILQFLPNIKQVACIWNDLPTKDWKPEVVYQTVQRNGQPKTQVTNVLVPRWDHVEISEKLTEKELDRRRQDTERIKAERDKSRQERQEKRAQAAKDGTNNDGDDEDDDDDDDDDEDDDEDEGKGPLVTMCIRDPTDGESVFWERGYLTDWQDEIHDVLAFSELPDHVRNVYDGTFTLPLVPCNAVCPAAKKMEPVEGHV